VPQREYKSGKHIKGGTPGFVVFHKNDNSFPSIEEVTALNYRGEGLIGPNEIVLDSTKSRTVKIEVGGGPKPQ
jgi:hypothetical protein